MRKNKLTKYAFLGGALMLCNIFLQAQQVVGTLKPGAAANQVDIFVKSNASSGSQYYLNLIFSVGLQTSCNTGTSPTAVLTYLGATGMSWSSADDAGTPTTGTTITSPTTTTSSGYKVYTFVGNNSNTTAANLPANTETKIATITFSGSPNSCPIFLMNNPNSAFDYFYMTMNTAGAVVDENDYNNNMYAVAPNAVVNDGVVGVKTGVNISLPLRMTSFDAVGEDNKVKLSWKTSWEENTAYFTVERSSDAQVFTALDQVPALNSALGGTYSWTDNSPLHGVNYYRLKMVDLNGRFAYSAIRMVRFGEQTGKLLAFPTNNQTGSLYVELPRGWEKANLTLLSSNGQNHGSSRVSSTSSLNRTVSLKGLSAGLYVVSIQNPVTGDRQTVKVNYQP